MEEKLQFKTFSEFTQIGDNMETTLKTISFHVIYFIKGKPLRQKPCLFVCTLYSCNLKDHFLQLFPFCKMFWLNFNIGVFFLAPPFLKSLQVSFVWRSTHILLPPQNIGLFNHFFFLQFNQKPSFFFVLFSFIKAYSVFLTVNHTSLSFFASYN